MRAVASAASELWRRALDARQQDKQDERLDAIRAGIAKRKAQGLPWGRIRKHSEPQIGDVVGCRRIVASLGPGRQGRADRSFRLQCMVTGETFDAFEFNLRLQRRCRACATARRRKQSKQSKPEAD